MLDDGLSKVKIIDFILQPSVSSRQQSISWLWPTWHSTGRLLMIFPPRKSLSFGHPPPPRVHPNPRRPPTATGAHLLRSILSKIAQLKKKILKTIQVISKLNTPRPLPSPLQIKAPPSQTIRLDPLNQAFPLDIRKKTQGEKNSELKKKTQTQAKNSTFRHFSKKYFYNWKKSGLY